MSDLGLSWSIFGGQNEANNIVSQSQNEQPNLGGNDDDSTERISVPDNDVRYICLKRSHQPKAIKHALQWADYNATITREVIYIIGQSGFTQLYNNAKLVAELLEMEDEVSFPKCRFPKVWLYFFLIWTMTSLLTMNLEETEKLLPELC